MKPKEKFNIEQFDPCIEALYYYKSKESFEQAWEDCHRGDWMLWIAQSLNVDIHTLTLAKARCAKTVIHHLKDERSVNAIEVAERFGLKKATLKELDIASRAAYAASRASRVSFTTSAASYAASAAYENRLLTATICMEILTKNVYKIIQE